MSQNDRRQRILYSLLVDSSGGGGGDNDPIGDALRASAVAYWKMDESNGNRADATGRGNTLSQEGGVLSSVSGLVGNAAAFIGNGAYLKCVDGADVRFLGSWAISFYINLNVDTAFKVVLNKGDASTEETDISIYIGNALGKVSGYSDDLSQSVAVTTENAISISTWHLIIIEYNDSTKRMSVTVDGGSQRLGNVNLSYSPFATSNPFLVGIWFDEVDQSLDASLQHLAKFSRVLTEEERSYLYNSGNGRTLYP